MTLTLPISPPELVADLLTRYGSTIGQEIPSTGQTAALVVGPATDAQQQAGIISITAAGLPSIEKYSPVQSHRAQIRCLGPDLDTADVLSQAVYADLTFIGQGRKLAYQTSNDSWYLIHLCNVTAGPSMHYDTAETWETLLFAELLMSSTPVPAPA